MARDIAGFIKPYVVDNGRKFRLRDHDPGDTRWVKSKEELKSLLEK